MVVVAVEDSALLAREDGAEQLPIGVKVLQERQVQAGGLVQQALDANGQHGVEAVHAKHGRCDGPQVSLVVVVKLVLLAAGQDHVGGLQR